MKLQEKIEYLKTNHSAKWNESREELSNSIDRSGMSDKKFQKELDYQTAKKLNKLIVESHV